MYKYYLIYEYHDTYVCEFCTIDRLEDYLNSLKKQYKYDRDFRYTIIYGKEVIVMNNFAIKIIKRESYKLKRCVNFFDYFMKNKIYEEITGDDK